MKLAIRFTLLLAVLTPALLCAGQADEEKAAESDPTSPSAKLEETMVKIRRVEDLDKVIADVARLVGEIEGLKQDDASLGQKLDKQAADTGKRLDGLAAQLETQQKLLAGLQTTLTKQASEQTTSTTSLAGEIDRLKQASAKDVEALGKAIDSVKQSNTALSEKLDKQGADFNAHLEKQQQLLAELQKSFLEQASRQNEIASALATKFEDLETRLTDIPPIALQGFATGEDQAGAALLDVGGSLRVVREGDTIQLQPQGSDSVIRTIRVKKISENSVLLEVGPWGQTLLLQ